MATLFRGSYFIAAASIVVCWLMLASGCNLFEPRDPEPPSQSSDSFIPPTDPDIVIENLQNAIAQKNSVNYVRCIADPSRTARLFEFFPSPDAGSRYASVFATWTVDQEKFGLMGAKPERPGAGLPRVRAALAMPSWTVKL